MRKQRYTKSQADTALAIIVTIVFVLFVSGCCIGFLSYIFNQLAND